MKYNVYCDESCHLEHDDSDVMVLGAMYCPEGKKREIYNEIRALKNEYGLNTHFEVKWTKVSKSKDDFYLALLDYFWNKDDISYRGLVVKGKGRLDHAKYNAGSHNLWYYKMYFLMLDAIISPTNQYDIFIDIKDTKGGKNIRKLHEVLCNNAYDFKQDVIRHIAQINSKESELLQLADLMNGAIGYYHRSMLSRNHANQGKISLVRNLMQHHNISYKTDRFEKKFNLLIWTPNYREGGYV